MAPDHGVSLSGKSGVLPDRTLAENLPDGLNHGVTLGQASSGTRALTSGPTNLLGESGST